MKDKNVFMAYLNKNDFVFLVSNQIKDAFLEGLGKAKHQVLPYQTYQTE